jgi:hydroxyacylglutathione hydrolase
VKSQRPEWLQFITQEEGVTAMRKATLSAIVLIAFSQLASFSQVPQVPIKGAEVFKNDEVVFHRLDEHTWVGSGHIAYNESLYLVEGSKLAVVIDAGTNIKNLDKIVATITKKPVMVVATHVHGDHVGSPLDAFPEIYINSEDKALIPTMMPNYKGKIRYLYEGQIIDLGGRQLEVVFTPGHTPGSTTFIDKNAGYGFSGDSFGSGHLLLNGDFSTLMATCRKMSAIMGRFAIKSLYPGHFTGSNVETKQRIDDMISICEGVLAGTIKGENVQNPTMGLDKVIRAYEIEIYFSIRRSIHP